MRQGIVKNFLRSHFDKEGGIKDNGFRVQGSGLAPRAWFPLITCERGSAGSTGLEGSTVVVRRIKIWKRRGGLKLAVFSYRKPNP